MPLLDRQRRGRQIGEIRLGITVIAKSGKKVPEKLDTFRFTTQSGRVAQAVATVLGGRVEQSELRNGKRTYEVITTTTEVPVMVPPGDAVISQWYEMWTAAGCSRRCDGYVNTITGDSCQCPMDLSARRELAKKGGACKPITRLNVMLPDIPDLGVWLVQSTGENAADELGGAADVLRAAREAGTVIPATLRMEQRESRQVGEQPHEFVVPVLEINASLRQMVSLEAGQDLASALPPPPPQLQALGSGTHHDLDDVPIEAELVDDHEGKPHSGAAAGQGIADRLQALDPSLREPIEQRIVRANFPDPLPSAAEKQVHRWIDEAEKDGAPFS